MSTLLVVMVGLAIVFDLINGLHDSSNIVATMISSHTLSPRMALGITAIAEFMGPFIFGVAVANTIGHEIVAAKSVTLVVLVAALSSAILWNLITGALGIPSSSSHALIGGLIGAVAINAGVQAIELRGLNKILIALFTSPILGLGIGYLFTKIIYFLARNATPKINRFFKHSQIFTAIVLALSHGANDAQKTMGVITLGLVVSGIIPSFQVPLWVIATSAGAIAIGTAIGRRSLIKTLGTKFYRVRPVHGFSAQISSAFVIIGASLIGGPVSTTQVVSSAIMGVGSAERLSKVRWGVAREILVAWLVTIPMTGLLAAGIYWILAQFPALMP